MNSFLHNIVCYVVDYYNFLWVCVSETRELFYEIWTMVKEAYSLPLSDTQQPVVTGESTVSPDQVEAAEGAVKEKMTYQRFFREKYYAARHADWWYLTRWPRYTYVWLAGSWAVITWTPVGDELFYTLGMYWELVIVHWGVGLFMLAYNTGAFSADVMSANMGLENLDSLKDIPMSESAKALQKMREEYPPLFGKRTVRGVILMILLYLFFG